MQANDDNENEDGAVQGLVDLGLANPYQGAIIWIVVYLFHYKDRSIIFPDLCSKDCDFWERILSLNVHGSLFYVLFYLFFYKHVVVVVVHEQGE